MIEGLWMLLIGTAIMGTAFGFGLNYACDGRNWKDFRYNFSQGFLFGAVLVVLILVFFAVVLLLAGGFVKVAGLS